MVDAIASFPFLTTFLHSRLGEAELLVAVLVAAFLLILFVRGREHPPRTGHLPR
jgi:hypothetical protein